MFLMSGNLASNSEIEVTYFPVGVFLGGRKGLIEGGNEG